MTTELVSSKSYLDNIKNYLPEEPNSSEKANRIFDQIVNSINFSFDRNDTRITDHFRKLLTIRPGQELFERLLKANQPLKIVFDSAKKNCLSHRRGLRTVHMARNDTGKRSYHFCVNSKGEKLLAENSVVTSLAHELIHALHHFEEGEFVQKKKERGTISEDLDNKEEQETIIGKAWTGTLCENVFRHRFGYPLRINHRGLCLKGEENFTASTYALEGALVNLRSLLSNNRSLLNLPQKCTGSKKCLDNLVTKYADIALTPLNAAIAAQQKTISDFLFMKSVNVNARDGYCGTALHTAIQTKQLDMVRLLLEKGADVNIRDPRGLTALELAKQLNHQEAVRLLTPPSLLQRCARKVGSLISFFFQRFFLNPLFALYRARLI